MNKRRILLAAVIALTSGLAQAQNGSWLSPPTSGNWTDSTKWTSGIIADGSGNTADFSSTLDPTADITVTLNGNRTIGNLIFGDTDTSTAAGWTVMGNTLTLAGATPTVTVNALGTGKVATISSIIAGSDGLTKSGVGSLTINGANTYTGATTVSQGTLLVANNSLALTSGYTVNDASTGANNTTLRFVGGFTNNRTGVNAVGIRDAAPITIANQGSGITTLEVDSTSGNWVNALVALNKAVTLRSAGGGIRGGFMTFSGPGAGAGNDTIIYDATGSGNDANWNTYENVGTYVMAPNTYTGNVRFTGGSTTLQNKTYGNAAFINMMIPDTASVTIDAGSTMQLAWGSETIDGLNGGGNVNVQAANATFTLGASDGGGTFTGVIANGSHALSLTKTGSGTQTLRGANTYTGATNINNGVLTLGVGGSLANTGSVTIANGATLNLSGSAFNQLAAGVTNGTLAINGTLNATTNQAHTLAIGTTYFANLSMNNGTLASTFATINTSGFGAFYFGTSRTITATGTNTISGQGVIGLGNGVALTLSPTNASDIINVTGSIINQSASTTGGVTKAGLGTVNFSGNNTYTGGTIVNGGLLKIDMTGRSTALTGSFAVNSTNGGTLELFNTNATIDNPTGIVGNTGAATFSGAGTINKTGSGYATFFAANANLSAFTGTINVVDGTLASNGGTWGTGTMTLNIGAGKTFDIRTGTVSVDKLTGDGTITTSFNSGAALVVGGAGGDSTFGGVLQNGSFARPLTKNGGGTFTLTGANTYTGTTTVNAGMLLANTPVTGTNSATGTGAVAVGVNGTLGGTGQIRPGSANAITVSGILAPGASIGTLTIDSAGSTAPSILTMASGSSFGFELGSAGASLSSVGTSDLLVINGSAVGDVTFNNNTIDFLSTGAVGYYKLFDTSLADATAAGDTWVGLTYDPTTGLVSSGLTASNLNGTGTFIVGTVGNGGNLGDIYLSVAAIPEPSTLVTGSVLTLGLFVAVRRRKKRSVAL